MKQAKQADEQTEDEMRSTYASPLQLALCSPSSEAGKRCPVAVCRASAAATIAACRSRLRALRCARVSRLPPKLPPSPPFLLLSSFSAAFSAAFDTTGSSSSWRMARMRRARRRAVVASAAWRVRSLPSALRALPTAASAVITAGLFAHCALSSKSLASAA